MFGEEGLQAVQCSDFAIANFRYLWKLILVQGRVNHYRISQFILLFFYKNILYTLPQLIYGYFSYFSGISLFDDWYLVLYNLLFTTVTVSYIGAFDVDVTYWKIRDNQLLKSVSDFFKKILTCGAKKSPVPQKVIPRSAQDESVNISPTRKRIIMQATAEQSENSFEVQKAKNETQIDESFINCKEISAHKLIKSKYQHLYYTSQKSIYFNIKSFLIELLQAFVVICAMVLTSQYVFSYSIVSIDGFTGDHWNVSFTVYSSIIMGVNIILLFRCRSMTWFLVNIIFFTSVLPYFIFMYIYDRLPSMNIESAYSTELLFGTVHFYLCLSINCMYVLIPEMLQLMKFYRIRPTLAEYFKVLIKFKKEKDPVYFEETAIQAIKKFWNPIKLQKNQADFSQGFTESPSSLAKKSSKAAEQKEIHLKS